jgi:glycosyltransferase involved in cell wall biosynthesis
LRVFLLAFGVFEHTWMLASALSTDADVTLALPAGAEMPALIPGVDHRFFALPRLRDPLGQTKVCASLRRAIHRAAPDVFHVQQGHLWFNAFLPAIRPPLAITVHDPRPHVGDAHSRKTPQWAFDFGFRRADRLMVHGARVKRELVEQCGVPEGVVDVLPPPMTEAIPESFDLPSCDPPTVLFFGRMWAYKGLDVLLRAQPLVSARVPRARFVIAGQGESLDRYREPMAMAGCFRLINEWISNDVRAELFRSATVVVLPYIEATQSAIVPVAYGYARPVVATRVGALPEIVQDGETGLLVPPSDEHALADALVRVLGDAALQRKLSVGARRYAERELSPAHMARATLESYERILTGAR